MIYGSPFPAEVTIIILMFQHLLNLNRANLSVLPNILLHLPMLEIVFVPSYINSKHCYLKETFYEAWHNYSEKVEQYNQKSSCTNYMEIQKCYHKLIKDCGNICMATVCYASKNHLAKHVENKFLTLENNIYRMCGLNKKKLFVR